MTTKNERDYVPIAMVVYGAILFIVTIYANDNFHNNPTLEGYTLLAGIIFTLYFSFVVHVALLMYWLILFIRRLRQAWIRKAAHT